MPARSVTLGGEARLLELSGKSAWGVDALSPWSIWEPCRAGVPWSSKAVQSRMPTMKSASASTLRLNWRATLTPCKPSRRVRRRRMPGGNARGRGVGRGRPAQRWRSGTLM